MKQFILRLFKRKPKPRMWPVVDSKNVKIYSETPIELILLIVAAICLGVVSCSPTASLPNGCTYKINAPKFKK